MAKQSILNDISQLNDQDLASRIQEEKLRYTKMKHMHVITPLESPVVIKKLRRDIARMTHVLEARKKQQIQAETK